MTGRRGLVRPLFVALTASALLVAYVPHAHAIFHLMRIKEVFGGTAEQPLAQFVELQMYTGNQNFVAGHDVTIYDASGNEAGSFVFTGNVSNGDSQSTILVATTQAQTLFGVEPDLLMDPVITSSGGEACFAQTDPPVDCVSWGNYSGDRESSGTPFNSPVGLVAGQSMERKISGGEDKENLDAEDDTNDSNADFEFASPSPTNNAGEGAGGEGEEQAAEHAREVTLKLGSRPVARGQVTAEGDYVPCVDSVPVKVQRRRSGRWKTVASTETAEGGSYKTRIPDRSGRYRAKAPEHEPEEGHKCLAAISPTRRR